jgi:hypothetical protein
MGGRDPKYACERPDCRGTASVFVSGQQLCSNHALQSEREERARKRLEIKRTAK